MSIYSRDGEFLSSWGEGQFSSRSHGSFMSRDGDLFLVDDGLGRVGRYTLDGKLLARIGPVGVTADTGYRPGVEDSVTHGGPPYNRPTNLSVGPNGDLYVSDGYGNARVHRFDAEGALLQSWGQPGPVPVSSGRRMAFGPITTAVFSSPTGRTTGSRSSAHMGSTWPSGRMYSGRRTYS